MSWIAVAIGGGALVGALGAQSAAGTQASAANAATNAQLQMFNTQNQQQTPYREAGYTSLKEMMGGLGLQGGTNASTTPGQFTHQFNAQDLTANLAPNYDFILKQGQAAARNLGNVSTGESSNTTKGVLDYTMGAAGSAYQQAFQNYTANQTNIFNRLSSVAGFGQTANQATSELAGSLAPSIANTTVGAGTARAAGTIGAANAISGGANNALGWYTLPQIMNSANSGNAGTYYIDNTMV